jgi:predicted PurR-regulated permease PerM/ribosomal protein S18 acetylase RimI-like enzyme
MATSPRWSATAKLICMLAVLAVFGYLLYRFQVLIMPLVMSIILAYLLDPSVTFLSKRLHLSRTIAVLLLYALLVLLLTGLLGGAGLLLQQQISGLLTGALNLINGLSGWVNSLGVRPISVGPFTFDLSSVNAALLQDALLPTVRDWIGGITQSAADAASGIAAFVGWTVFAFIVAFYLLHDMSALQRGLLQLVPEDFQADAKRLLKELGPIWNAFLRGQLLLSLIMGTAVGLTTFLLGIRYSLVLGILAALAEFVPMIGANVVGLIAFLIAVFQPANWFGWDPLLYAVVVVAAAGLLQQLEGYFLIPRIMGGELKLHPALLLVGALVAVSLLGLPGLLLSGPIIASARLFGKYLHAKLFDLPSWPAAELPPAVRIRPARDSDRKDMLALTAQIWEGRDYAPRVWSEWLADREGVLAAAELQGRMVGFGKLTRLAPREWWLEGLRVHPEFQGLKIGSRLTEHLAAEWTKRGGGALRLATSSERVKVHHLCERLGLRHAGTFRLMGAAPLRRSDPGLRPMQPADAAEALAAWREQAARTKSDLVDDSWKWSRMSENRLADFIRRGDAWRWGERKAFLLTSRLERNDRRTLEIAAVLAAPGTLPALLRRMRALAGAQKADDAVWVMPDEPRLLAAARRAGFRQTWDARLWLFERNDSEDNPRNSMEVKHADSPRN